MSAGNLRELHRTASAILMQQYEAEMMMRRFDEDERNMRGIVGREQFVDAQRLRNERIRMILDNAALSVPAAILVNRDVWQEFERECKAKKNDPNAAMIERDEQAVYSRRDAPWIKKAPPKTAGQMVLPALTALSREWAADQKTGATMPGALKEL